MVPGTGNFQKHIIYFIFHFHDFVLTPLAPVVDDIDFDVFRLFYNEFNIYIYNILVPRTGIYLGLSYIYVVVPVFSIGTYYTFPTEGGYLVERRILDSEASPPPTTYT